MNIFIVVLLFAFLLLTLENEARWKKGRRSVVGVRLGETLNKKFFPKSLDSDNLDDDHDLEDNSNDEESGGLACEWKKNSDTSSWWKAREVVACQKICKKEGLLGCRNYKNYNDKRKNKIRKKQNYSHTENVKDGIEGDANEADKDDDEDDKDDDEDDKDDNEDDKDDDEADRDDDEVDRDDDEADRDDDEADRDDDEADRDDDEADRDDDEDDKDDDEDDKDDDEDDKDDDEDDEDDDEANKDDDKDEYEVVAESQAQCYMGMSFEVERNGGNENHGCRCRWMKTDDPECKVVCQMDKLVECSVTKPSEECQSSIPSIDKVNYKLLYVNCKRRLKKLPRIAGKNERKNFERTHSPSFILALLVLCLHFYRLCL